MRSALLSSSIPLLLPLLAIAGCDSCGAKPQVFGADGAPVATVIYDAAPLNATPLPTASVEKMVNSQRLPAYAGPVGTIEGTIFVTGDPAPDMPAKFDCPDAVKTYGKSFRSGEPKTAAPNGPRWLADAVVAVTGYSGFYVQEKDEAEEVTIKGCALARRTVTMTFGQRLEVKNETKEFWTPLLVPSPGTVMMMAAPGGDAVKLYPKVPGHYLITDHDRRWATDDLYVFLHPLHTSSALEGTYRIEGVPVGKVKVNTSHPRIKNAEASMEIDVKQGQVHKADLTIDHKQPPDAGAASGDGGAYYPPLH